MEEWLGLVCRKARLYAEDLHRLRFMASGERVDGLLIENFLFRGRAEVQRVFEHRPETLFLSVNSLHLGLMKITSISNNLRLSIHDRAPIDYVEVFSERGVRMLFFEVKRDSSEQSVRIDLSDKRVLKLVFKNKVACSLLRVSYYDPLLQQVDPCDPIDAEMDASTHAQAVRDVSTNKPATAGSK